MNAPSTTGIRVDAQALVGKGVTWNDPEREVSYDVNQLLERAAGSSIERLCVVPPRCNDYESANRELSRICEQHQSQLIGFAAHNPIAEAGRLKRALTEEVHSMGLRGVRSDGHPTRELLDVVRDLQIPVIYYPQPAPPVTAQSPVTPARWYHTMLSVYPDVQFILPHLGNYCSEIWWGHLEAIDLVKRYRNIYLDTSGIGSIKYLEMAVKELPSERILFASFSPELDPRIGVETIRLMKLSREASTNVMGNNMSRLLAQKT